MASLSEVRALLSLPLHTARRDREQWLDPERLRQLRASRLAHLAARATRAPFYARRLDGANGAPEALRKLPPVSKKEFLEAGLESFLTAGRAGLITMTTSGSTGQPTVFLRSPAEETEFSARWWRVYSAYGARARDTLFNLGRTNTKPRNGAVALMRAMGLLPRVVTVAVAAPVAESARTLCELRPRFITGFAIGVEALAEYVVQNHLSLPPPKAVICGAMEVTERCRQLVRDAFGAPAVNVYATNEFGVIAWECPVHRGALHVNDDVFELEILKGDEPVADGTEGEVVLTALTLERMPLIRFRTGDLAARIPGACPCGRGLSLMTPVRGRTAHSIRTPGGGFITAPLLASAFGTSGAYEWAGRFQVHEQEGAVLRVLLETRRLPSAQERERLLAELERVTDHQFSLQLQLEGALQLAPTGKFQYVVPLGSGTRASA
jgi:phenylacetate-CoA ligase